MKDTQITAKPASFYVVGGTLRGDAPSYVSRKADIQLYESLKNNDVCYVLTARQMGKSSLMVRTAARLRDEGVSVAVLDLTGLGQNLTPEQWYNGLLERFAQQFDLEDELDDAWARNEELGPLQRWVRAVRDVVVTSRRGRPVVVFIDEIDAVRSLAFSTDEFFAGIRELYNRRAFEPDLQRLAFCLLGVASPSDLIRDTRTTPFNIGQRIQLTDFTETEAAPLAQGLGRELKVGSALLRRVLFWTGGHPYLTQRLCQAVAESNGTENAAGVDRICRELFLSHRARERDDNLLFVRERILRSEVDTSSVLTLYRKIRKGKRVRDDDNNQLMSVLRLSGITKIEDGYLKVRNRVYATVFDDAWVISNMPGAELRRQRAAYVKGIKVAALALAPIILIGGYSFFSLYKQRGNLPPISITPPRPPAFWASFSISSAADVNNGSLSLKTHDSNVTVFLNNHEYGHTDTSGDLLIERLPAGTYSIRVEKTGFQSVSQQARVEPRKIAALTFKLQPQLQAVAAASILIQGAPEGAEVKLDGERVGLISPTGDLTFTARPGEHLVSVAKEGFIPIDTKQEFTQGVTIILKAAIKADIEAQRWQAVASAPNLNNLQAFLKQYPDGRFSVRARSLAEEAEWNSLKDSENLELLTAFVSNYPQGRHAQEARNLMKALEQEQLDWIGVRNTKDAQKLEDFRKKYPQSQMAGYAEAEIGRLKSDEEARADADTKVRGVLKRYAEAYQSRSTDALRRIWPTLDSKRDDTLRHSFSVASDIRLQISVTKVDWTNDYGEATVLASSVLDYVPKGEKPRTSTSQVVFHLRRSNGTWLITEVSPGR